MLVSLLLSCNVNQYVIICFCHLTSRIYLFKRFFLFIFIVLKLYFTLSCNPLAMFRDTTCLFPLNLVKPADLELIAKLRLFIETWKIQACVLHQTEIIYWWRRTQSKANNVISSSQYCTQVYLLCCKPFKNISVDLWSRFIYYAQCKGNRESTFDYLERMF